jgi:hypothetical protein
VIQLALDDHTLETLLTFDADAAELGGQGDDEPDAEADSAPVAADLARPKVNIRRRPCAGIAPPERPSLRLATSS